jgi:hypothetical protein
MILFIKVFNDSSNDLFKMEMDISDSVCFLKQKIEEQMNIKVERQRLLYQGIPMLDDCLYKYNLRENSVIHLVYKFI